MAEGGMKEVMVETFTELWVQLQLLKQRLQASEDLNKEMDMAS